jgi:hypothetical protein
MKYRDTQRFRLLIAEYNQISANNLKRLAINYKIKMNPAKISQQNDITYRIDGLTIKG